MRDGYQLPRYARSIRVFCRGCGELQRNYLIVSRCTELESGARTIDSILTNTLLPRISQELLTRMMEGIPVTRVATTVKEGDFDYAFDESTEPAGPPPEAQPPAPPATGDQPG